MKGRNCPYGWMDEVNEMRPEAVPVPVPGVLPEDGDEAPLLEAPEEVSLGLLTDMPARRWGLESPAGNPRIWYLNLLAGHKHLLRIELTPEQAEKVLAYESPVRHVPCSRQDMLPGIEGYGDPECNDCEIPDHGGKNWCDPCGGWIDGEPCDLT